MEPQKVKELQILKLLEIQMMEFLYPSSCIHLAQHFLHLNKLSSCPFTYRKKKDGVLTQKA